MSAPLRIQRSFAGQSISGPAVIKGYFERLVKLIPSEVIGLYLLGQNLIPDDQILWKSIWTVFCLVATFLSRMFLTSDAESQVPPQWLSVVMSCCAYVVWSYSMAAQPWVTLGIHRGFVASILVIAFTFIVPLFHRGGGDEYGVAGPAAAKK